MTEAKNVKVKVSGTVKSNFKDADSGKRSVNLYITPQTAEFLEEQIVQCGMEWHGDRFPVKEETETGRIYLASRSSFDIPVKHLAQGWELEDIGKGSKVTLYCNIKEGEYRHKKYVSAYILGIDVVELVEKEMYDVFSEDGFTESEAGGDVFPDLDQTADKTATE